MEYIKNLYKLHNNTDSLILKCKYRQEIGYFINNKNNAKIVIDNWNDIYNILINIDIYSISDIPYIKETIENKLSKNNN